MNSRIVFISDPKLFFQEVKKGHFGSWQAVAKKSGVSIRTLNSWRTRNTSMPLSMAKIWSKSFQVPIPSHTVIDLDEKRKAASSTGGKARFKLHGDFGTAESRRLGGLRGWKTHKKKDTSPFVARSVQKPAKNEELAELVGAILGDGMITNYQLVLYSNLTDDTEYADFLFNLIMRIFSVRPSIVRNKKQNVIKIIVSRKNLIKHLMALGLNPGSKIKRQASVPRWIERNRNFRKACVRGLIDTDGSVYSDKHTVKGKKYASICIAFTSASIPLLDFVDSALKKEGFVPTRWGRHIRVRRHADVLRYGKEIGFSNPKHARKIKV